MLYFLEGPKKLVACCYNILPLINKYYMVNLSNRNLLVLFGPILDTKVVYSKENSIVPIREIQGMEQHCFAQLYVHTKPILESVNSGYLDS